MLCPVTGTFLISLITYVNQDVRALPSMNTSKTCFLDLIIRGDGVLVGGCTWVQLSIDFMNFGRLSRMLPYLWTIAVGVVPKKATLWQRHGCGEPI